jgi:hypothetical protein
MALFGAAAVGAIAFTLIERRMGSRALIPADLLRNRSFFASCMAVLMMSAIFFAAGLVISVLFIGGKAAKELRVAHWQHRAHVP